MLASMRINECKANYFSIAMNEEGGKATNARIEMRRVATNARMKTRMKTRMKIRNIA